MNKIKWLLTKTRFIYIIAFLVMSAGLGFLYVQETTNSTKLNHQFKTERVESKHTISNDHTLILKYRAKNRALEDQHLIYLTKHPKLKYRLKHLHPTASLVSMEDNDNESISELHHQIYQNEDLLPLEVVHRPSTNAMHMSRNIQVSPKNTKLSQMLTVTGAEMTILFIIDLVDLVFIFRFGDKKSKKPIQKSQDKQGASNGTKE